MVLMSGSGGASDNSGRKKECHHGLAAEAKIPVVDHLVPPRLPGLDSVRRDLDHGQQGEAASRTMG